MLYWITGASSGIGKALALHFAGQGHKVAISARSGDALEAMTSSSTNLFSYPLDVTDKTELGATVDKIVHDLGSIDVAILNAGTYVIDDVKNFKSEDIEKQFAVNVIGMMNALGFLIPLMRASSTRSGGHIALMASVAGYRGLPHGTGYGGTKAAVINMAESMKAGLQEIGIKLQVICPGFVKTPLTDKNPFPMPFLIPVEEAVIHIERGLASRRFEIVFPWQMTIVMKIVRLLPYWLLFPVLKRLN